VALCFAREEVDQWPIDQSTQRWQRNDRGRAEHNGERRLENVEEEVREAVDEIPKNNRANTSAEAHDQAGYNKHLGFGWTQSLE
jgi:hypothetical protein